MAKYSASDIAKWFIWKYKNCVENSGAGEKLTLLKLLKLLYYAEGSSLALNNKSLFDDKIMAWEHGPVIKKVYDEYKKNPYELPLSNSDIRIAAQINADEKVQNILEQVFDVFGGYSAWGLRNMTHQEKPWLEATNNGSVLKREISKNAMKEFFKSKYVQD